MLKKLSDYSLNNDFEKIKDTTLKIEKTILDTYKSDTDFNRLIDHITFYSDYSLLNTLLIDYQYPDFLSLSTKNKYENNGYEILENATTINILSPNNEIFVKVNDEIKNLSELNSNEVKKFNDDTDNSITFHHKEFKGLKIVDLYDVKDTNMNRSDYSNFDMPALFQSSYNDIYNSFVKAIYADGYKVKYCDLDTKFSFDKNTKTINIKNGLNNQIKILSLLEVYSNVVSNNDLEKDLLSHVICKGIGIDKDFRSDHNLVDWYKNTDIKDVDKSLKLIAGKGKKFINNFNRFYDMEEKTIVYNSPSLYDDFNLAI